MPVTVIAHADRVGCRPDRLADRLARNPAAADWSLVVVDAAGDERLADRLRPYPHVRWAVVRPAGEGGGALESVRPADRWVFLPADGVLLGDLASLLAGGEAAAETRRWPYWAAAVADDLCSDVRREDCDGPATAAVCFSADTRNWRRDPNDCRTCVIASARCMVCGPEPAGRFLPRPGDRVEVVAEYNK